MDWPTKRLIGPRPQVTLDERVIFISCLVVWFCSRNGFINVLVVEGGGQRASAAANANVC